MVSMIPVERIQTRILLIRAKKVIIDQDLAKLYGVDTGQITRQVRRNKGRFPDDFAFRLTKVEFDELKRSITSTSWGGRRYRPWVFSEQGVAMLSSVLRSPQAIEVSVQIMRAFVQLRELVSSHDLLRTKLAELEDKLTEHDIHFRTVFDAIRQLMQSPPRDDRQRIGFNRRHNE